MSWVCHGIAGTLCTRTCPCLLPVAAQTAGYDLLIITWGYIWLPAHLQPCLQRGLGTSLTEKVCFEHSELDWETWSWGQAEMGPLRLVLWRGL